MKKVKRKIGIGLIALLLAATMNVTALCAGNFVNSPSVNSFIHDAEGYVIGAQAGKYAVMITPYKNKQKIVTDAQNGEVKEQIIEDAYQSVKNNEKDYNKLITEIGKNKKIARNNLVVADIFDVSLTADSDVAVDGVLMTFVKLTLEQSKNFVALLRYDGETWSNVDNVAINNGIMSFKTEEMVSFAILVKGKNEAINPDEPVSPQTGDVSHEWVIALFVAAGAALTTIAKRRKNA